ncbi:MAG: nucleotidyl transferase AbiEii/AbiGii toxin family protein, partial [Elusimicrobiota bacterium]
GTALRILHGLMRFSEDLDFDADSLTLGGWTVLLEETAHELSRVGLSVQVRGVEKGSLLTGDIRFLQVLHAYHIASQPTEKLRVKVEANRPGYPLSAEPRLVSAYGEMVAVEFAASGLIFAEKLLAFLNREQGRDVYDLFFMAGKRWVPDLRVLAARGVGPDFVSRALARMETFTPQGLNGLARRLEPFLFDPAQAALVAQGRELLPGALQYLNDS